MLPICPQPSGRTLSLALAVAVLTLACYWGAVSADFVAWDDDINLYENPRIQRLSTENLRWMFVDLEKAMRYKPVSWLAWAGIYKAAGLKPAAYHLANVLLHTFNAVLLFFLLRELLGITTSSLSSPQNEVGAAVGALFWSLHPLRVEPVAWATGLPYCLSLSFALLMLLCYWRFATAPAGAQPRWLYAFAVGCFLLALLTYPIVISLAVTPVAMDWWIARRRGERKPWLRWRHAPFCLAAAVLAGVTLFARLERSTQFGAVTGLDDFTLAHRIAQAFYVWAYYCWRMVWTVGLSPLYLNLTGFSPWDWPFLVSGTIVTATGTLLLQRRALWPAAWAIFGCHLAWLLPVLGLTEDAYVPSDRYSYAHGMLGGLALAVGVRWLLAGNRTATTAITALLLLVSLAILSVRQTSVWRDTPRLFTHMIEHAHLDLPRSRLWFGLAGF